MTKVAIITFHRALNYGAKLQTFALLEVVNTMSEGEILDYRNEAIERFYHNKSFKTKIKSCLKWIMHPVYMREIKKRRQLFREFDERLVFSRTYFPKNVHQSDGCYDCFIVGSDQVWNPIITNRDITYFLPFCEDRKRNSYAASLGKGNLNDFRSDCLKDILESFRIITVRERAVAHELYRYDAKLKPVVVCDPVFLMSKDEWEKKFNLVNFADNKKYVFVYIVAKQTNSVEKARSVANFNNWRVKFIDMGRVKIDGIEAVNDVGPTEFLKLLYNAELIITTSFHAFALSLILHKPVQYELSREKNNANSRLAELAENVGLKKYEIKNADNLTFDDYDWVHVDKCISDMRTYATDLLHEMIFD